ncbi:L-lactate dehydrogenase [Halobacteroides halobius DSM 5150]|uniref:L-lactate dehydrogenase n=1 Tax=Halobacteroides halobius (strain ATCC 35273 / DSM 5150 / MD-1) TaxID=748449 RepID=L0K5P2_HALHC|nr:L-lactate dehydrogenase [Halobacteroides halobius]AGB40311.1 L-lactate dehydrogenase [Halobacteroides halobius DSM 5150]
MKVVVIGAGMVGSDVTGRLLAQGSISEIVLVDINQDKAEGEVMDYSHTTSYNYNPSASLEVGDYSDCQGADLIVLTAGPSIKEGQSRRDLALQNAQVTKEIMEQIIKYTTDALIIPVTNPVDVVTYTAVKSGYDRDKVIGTGTIVDSARLMRIIGNKYQLDPKNIFGYILGEHGKVSFVPWSIAGICGYDFETFAQIRGLDVELNKKKITKQVQQIGFDIWKKKGYTNHGIAAGVARIVKAISLDEEAVLPVSVYLDREYEIEGVALSVPCIIGEQGIEKILEFPLTKEELKKLEDAAKSLENTIKEIKV